MSADVLTFAPRRRPLTREQLQDFLTNDTYVALGVQVWWGRGHELLVATPDRAVAALAADAVVRRQLGDSLPAMFGGVAVEEPMSVEVLPAEEGPSEYQPADLVTWQRATRPGRNTVLVCRVWAGEDGVR